MGVRPTGLCFCFWFWSFNVGLTSLIWPKYQLSRQRMVIGSKLLSFLIPKKWTSSSDLNLWFCTVSFSTIQVLAIKLCNIYYIIHISSQVPKKSLLARNKTLDLVHRSFSSFTTKVLTKCQNCWSTLFRTVFTIYDFNGSFLKQRYRIFCQYKVGLSGQRTREGESLKYYIE